jgi:hypothetical protein
MIRSPLSQPRTRRSSQSGYAYITALFMVVLILAGTTVFLEDALTEAQRRREEEMIWRGNQYKRAIRLYFHKTGHYPQDMEALQKGLPQLHFLRQAYKDPMNTADGSWRYIYVNAAGQIIGSTRFASLQQMALIDNPQLMAQTFPQLGVSASSLANSGPGSNNLGGSSFSSFSLSGQSSSGQNPPSGNPGDNSGGASTPPPTGDSGQSSTTTSTDQSGTGSTAQPAQPGPSTGGSDQPLQNPILLQKPTGPVDGPVLGAFLTGVASTVDSPSRKWFHHAKKYLDWEFIWNPLDDQAAAAQQQNTAIPLLGQPAGGSGFGQGGSAFGQGGSGFGGSPFGSGGTSPFGGSTPQPQPQGNPPQ